ncbi:MAG: hypothetical protein P8R37_12440 [Opitutae bacterium]|nr:hypothetical protein [Opitutae bacterium]
MNTKLQTTSDTELAVDVFDTPVFDACYKIAEVLAQSSMIPESLKLAKGVALPIEQVAANCMLIVEQAHRWGMSPFACISCASVVHGKLQWEGKLVAAVLEAKLGLRLNYDYSGEGEGRKVVVSGIFQDESEARKVDGSVEAWKTTGNGSPWSPANYDRQLAYRGAREWARRHAPASILGVVTNDEQLQTGAKNVTGSASNLRAAIDPYANASLAIESVAIENVATAILDLTTATVADVVVTNAPDDSWTRYRVQLLSDSQTITATTFSTTVGRKAVALKGAEVTFATEETDKGTRLLSIDAAPAATNEGALL